MKHYIMSGSAILHFFSYDFHWRENSNKFSWVECVYFAINCQKYLRMSLQCLWFPQLLKGKTLYYKRTLFVVPFSTVGCKLRQSSTHFLNWKGKFLPPLEKFRKIICTNCFALKFGRELWKLLPSVSNINRFKVNNWATPT